LVDIHVQLFASMMIGLRSLGYAAGALEVVADSQGAAYGIYEIIKAVGTFAAAIFSMHSREYNLFCLPFSYNRSLFITPRVKTSSHLFIFVQINETYTDISCTKPQLYAI